MKNQPFQRNTKQREVILQELRKLKTHPTAAGLYQIVLHRLPKISLGTVYRNLDLLVKAGAIQKLEHGSEEARFDGEVTPHHHIRCVKCGRVDDIHGLSLDPLGGVTEDFNGYRVLGQRIEFFGLCARCKE
jgi:Fur family ferric uptake transcriptional regulator